MKKRKQTEGFFRVSVRRKAKSVMAVILTVFMLNYIICCGSIISVNAEAPTPTITTIDGVEYYQLGNANDLVWFREQVNTGNYKINAVLTADIDLSSVCGSTVGNWKPIGKHNDAEEFWKDCNAQYGYWYQGIFDGQGHEIKNLYYNDTTTTTNFYGLFGWMKGTVKNLGVVNIDISTTANNTSGIGYTSGTIINCYTSGTILTTGGIVGGIASCNVGAIENCWSSVTLSSKSSKPKIGGIIGSNNRYDGYTPKNCYYTATNGNNGYGTQITADELKSGKVAYLLNGSSSHDVTWYQTLGSDSYPVLNSSYSIVYPTGTQKCPGTEISNIGYSNTSDGLSITYPEHNFKDGLCTECGRPRLKDGYYQIGTVAALKWFANAVNSGSTSISAVLTADIDLAGEIWTPIGLYSDSLNPDYIYAGTFDGAGHTISNLTVNQTSNHESGLFGRTNGATIKNLGIVNAAVTNSAGTRAGVLGGEISQSTVENCFTAGTITITTDHSQKGGIAGEAVSSTFINCYTTYKNLGNSGTWTNCYYVSESDDGKGGKTTTQFASGEVAYLLNVSRSDDVTWYQNLNTDSYPVLNKSHSIVYYNASNNSYSNTEVLPVPYITLAESNISEDSALEVTVKLNGEAYTQGITYAYANKADNQTTAPTDDKSWTAMASLSDFKMLAVGDYWLKVSVAGTENSQATEKTFAFTKKIANVRVEIDKAVTGYSTIEKAWEAVNADSVTEATLILYNDMKTSSAFTLNSGRTLTIDLNGHTWTDTNTDEDVNTITYSGNMIIKDSATNGKMCVGTKNFQRGILRGNSGVNLKITGGTFEVSGSGSVIAELGWSQSVTVTGGTFSNTSGNAAIYVMDDSTFTMNGGKVEQGSLSIYGVGHMGGSAALYGGTFAKLSIDGYNNAAKEPYLMDILLGGAYYADKTSDQEITTDLSSSRFIENVTIKRNPIIIHSQPSCANGNLEYGEYKTAPTLSVTANGEDIHYQWYQKIGDNAATKISGATTASYTIPNGMELGDYQYYCVLTSGGYSLETKKVFITVGYFKAARVIKENDATFKDYLTIQEAVDAAEDGSIVKLITSNTQLGSTINMKNKKLIFDLNGKRLCGTMITIINIENSELTFTDSSNSQDGYLFCYSGSPLFKTDENSSIVIESGKYRFGKSFTCTNLKIEGGIIDALPLQGSVCVIQASNLTVSGGSFTEKIAVKGDKVIVSGGTFGTFSVTGNGDTKTISDALTDGYAFRSTSDRNVWITDSDTLTATSISNVTVEKIPISITSQPKAASAVYSYLASNAPQMSVTAKGLDGNNTITYQWYSVATGSKGADEMISGATSASYTILTGKDVGEYQYYCVVTCDGYSLKSDTVKVTVSQANGSITIKDDYKVSYPYTGNTIAEPSESQIDKLGDGKVTFEWYGGKNEDGTVTGLTKRDTAPVEVGNYTLKAIVGESANYKTAYKTVLVTITEPEYSIFAVSKDTTGADISATLKGLGSYVNGTLVTVEAPIADGYNFVGWYQASKEALGYTGDILSKNRVYTFKVNENTNLVAVYKPLGTASITVDGGNSYTINGSGYTEPNAGTYSLGTNVTVAVSDEKDFAYWADEHGMIVSREASYTFPVTGSMTLTAVYNIKTENKSTVIFESYYGQVMRRMQLGSGDAVTMPESPTRYGYTFTKWSMTADEIKNQIAAGTAVIRVTPVYELINQPYAITITGGTGSGSYKQNDVVTATADAPEEGKKFSHWTDAVGNILSYSETYQFYATENVTVTANYVAESTVVEAKGTAEIVDVKKDTTNSRISFVSMLTVPEGCTIQMAGIIATTDKNIGNSGDGFNKDTAAYVRGNAWSGNAYRFTWTKKVTEDQTWYVRAYLLYKDINGNLVTVYGAVMTAELNN